MPRSRERRLRFPKTRTGEIGLAGEFGEPFCTGQVPIACGHSGDYAARMKLLSIVILLGGAVYAAMLATYPGGTDPATDCTEILIARCISFPTNGPGIEVEHFKPPTVVV